jgi:LuxR family maltose regulon positive regulatory protein
MIDSTPDSYARPLLVTKLYIPPPRPQLVRRTRLLARLDESMSRALTLISAPAGFGKTTLISDWIAQTNAAVAWVSLDENDDDPARFFAYVIAALQTLHADIGQTALALIQAQPNQPAAMETALTLLLNELAGIPRPFALILDDYHLLHSQPIHNAVAFLLDRLPPQMHLVLIARADPPFTLARLRVRNQLVELRAADLRFTMDEAAAFLNNVMHLDISAHQVAALAERTEGWIAGLQLAALSMQGRGDVRGFIDSFAGSHRLVLNYLIEEVLQRQPESIQEFLLQTSVLDRLTAPLCDAVTKRSDSQSMLENLERANLFLIPLDDEGRWYRYHHLFVDTLRARLAQSQPQWVPELHRRASAWFAQHHQATDAVTHALAAKDYARAAQWIEAFEGAMYAENALPTLIHWIQALPRELVQSRPNLAMIGAWALLGMSRSEEAEQYLQLVERAVNARADELMTPDATHLTPEVRAALIEVTIVRSALTMPQYDFPEKIRRLRHILPYLTDDAPYLHNPPPDLRAVVYFNMALAHEFSGESNEASQAFAQAIALARERDNIHIVSMSISHLAQLDFVQGRLHRAAETYREALQMSSSFPSPLVGSAHTGLGNVLYEWNELDPAYAELRQGIELGKVWSNWETLLPGYAGVARVRLARGDRDGAFATLDELADLIQRSHATAMEPALDAFRAEMSARCGNGHAAARWVDANDLRAIDPIPYVREDEGILLARALIALHRAQEARALLDKLLAGARAGQRTRQVIAMQTLQAQVLHLLGEETEALAVLRQALTLAEPEGYVRTFVDGGETLRDLLAKIGSGYAHKLIEAFPDAAKDDGSKTIASVSPSIIRPSSLSEPLSAREREVLRLIAAGLSNQDIADKLVISIRTVKKHIENIYAKIDAKSRTQAIAKARELGLLE